MYASVKLPIQTAPNALVVPVQSVESTGNGVGNVLVVDPSDHVQPRTVKLGLQTATKVEILSGLQENEKVVFGEQSQFQAGELVKPINTSAATE